MSYATPEELRALLDQEDATTDATLQTYLDRAHSRLNEALGFRYNPTGAAETVTARLDGEGGPDLWLPPPGAETVTSVVEDGVSLTAGTDYELDTLDSYHQTITRLDGNGYEADWPCGRRLITVVYTRKTAPDALIEAELEEAIRLMHGKAAGFNDVVGTSESGGVRMSRAFTAGTYTLIQFLKDRHSSSGVAGQ